MMVLGQKKTVLVGTWWYWVSTERFWLVLGGTGWYLVVLGQHGAVLVGFWWYLVSMGPYWLVLSGTGLVMGFYACIYLQKWRFGKVS